MNDNMVPKPANVMFYNSRFFSFYGAQKSLCRLIQYIDRERFTPIVVCPARGIFTEEIGKLDVEVRILPLPEELLMFGGVLKNSSFPQRVMQFYKSLPQTYTLVDLIRRRKIQLMHCNGLRSVLTSGWAAKLAGIPLVWHLRADESFGYLDLIGYLLSDEIITVSDGVIKAFSHRPLFRSGQKMVTVYDGLPQAGFDPTKCKGNLRREFGFENEHQVIGIVASITPRKRQDRFIEMAKAISSRYEKTRFLIVGDVAENGSVPYKQRLLSIGKELIDEGRLVFTGWRDDVAEIYASLDIFVLPSASEGLPQSILEAMCMAKPVVATNIAGASEAVLDGKTGYLVPLDDLPALVGAVENLLNDPTLRVKMGLLGRQRVVENFSDETHARNVEQVFWECLSKIRR